MIGQSQSGTGKTAAFVLTMLSRVDFSIQAPQAIALAPSRELARQIMDVVQEMGKYTSVKTAYAIPDAHPPGTKIDAHIIVGTPGKSFDLIKKKSIDTKQIKVFVLDEADNMLDQQGLGEQSIRVKKSVVVQGCRSAGIEAFLLTSFLSSPFTALCQRHVSSSSSLLPSLTMSENLQLDWPLKPMRFV